MPTACVIYCRVSSRKQLVEGDGLRSQEQRCRMYAQSQGYEVRRVFREEALSGGSINRKAMDALLLYLGAQPPGIVVMIEDLKRFARDVEIHFDLKFAIFQRGGRLESPLFRFEDTPEGKFIETIVAAQAELERNQNKRQVVSRMKARLEQGFWTFNPTAGYVYKSDPLFKKVLVPDAVKAPLVTEALEGFAQGRFASAMDVTRFLAGRGFFGPRPDLRDRRHLLASGRMLRHPLYTGHVEYRPWGVSLRKGHHAALISLDTHLAIRRRLDARMPAAPRADTQADFVLRGFVACCECGTALTASWSRGEFKRYPYYHCRVRQCGLYGKAIPRSRLEMDFLILLAGLAVTPETLALAQALCEDVLALKLRQGEEERRAREKEVERLDADLVLVADRLARSPSEVVARALERRIEELSLLRAQRAEELVPTDTLRVDVGTAFSRARNVLQNPRQTWEEGDLDMKRLVARLVFTGLLRYDRNKGFGTADLSLPYLIFGQSQRHELHLVDLSAESWNGIITVLLEWQASLDVLEGGGGKT